MFGYVTVCQPELKVKELVRYRSFYCGLCHKLKEEYGGLGQLTLTYDMTFLVLLLTSLYECGGTEQALRCRVHPLKKQAMFENAITAYAADLNVLLAYYQMEDDWRDERSLKGLGGTAAYRRAARRAAVRYPRQAEAIRKNLARLHKLEREDCRDLDRVAGCFGRVTAELFAYRRDVWERTLRRLGFYLGKFIYLMDAWEDLKEDERRGRYNPLKGRAGEAGYEEQMYGILCMMMAECTGSFERLPCLEDLGILRNILYQGVWTRYRKRMQEKNGDGDNERKESL